MPKNDIMTMIEKTIVMQIDSHKVTKTNRKENVNENYSKKDNEGIK